MRILLIVTMIATVLLTTTKAYADTNCLPMYGGGESCGASGITIEKDVVNPSTHTDTHDLGQDGPFFTPGQTVTFHITIHNNSSDTINNATITDIFPQGLTFASGPGNFDTNSRQLTFPINSLASGQSQTFTVTGTVDGSQLTNNQPLCVSNIAFVTVNNQSTQDSSQFCMEQANATAVLAAFVSPTPAPTGGNSVPTQSPATGASDIAWLLLAGMGGLIINKYTNRQIDKYL